MLERNDFVNVYKVFSVIAPFLFMSMKFSEISDLTVTHTICLDIVNLLFLRKHSLDTRSEFITIIRGR